MPRPDLQQSFGELRSVLAGPPSPASWARLVGLLGPWMDAPEFSETLLPYAARALERWPEQWRRAPRAWLRRAAFGEPTPGLALARVWVLAHDNAWLSQNPSRLHNLLRHPTLSCATHLQLGHLPRDLETLRQLSTRAPALRALVMEGCCATTASLEGVLRWPADGALARLMLHDNFLDDAFVEALVDGALLTGLRALDLSENRVTAQGVKRLGASPALAQLEEVRVDSAAVPHAATLLARSPHLSTVARARLSSQGASAGIR